MLKFYRYYLVGIVAVLVAHASIGQTIVKANQGQPGTQGPWSVISRGVLLDQTNVVKYLNCAAAGSAAQFIPSGTYLMTVLDETTTLCLNATCDGGYGTAFPGGFGMLQNIYPPDGGAAGQFAGCLSAGATGDLYFTKINVTNLLP